MNRASAITSVIVLSFSLLGVPAVWAADPAAATPAKDVTDLKKPDQVLKTKTKSNQSNDRQADAPPAQDTVEDKVKDKADSEQPAEILKTKTKSNQSND